MAHMHLNLKTYPLSLCIDFVFDIKIAGCDTNLVFFSDKVRWIFETTHMAKLP